MANTEVSVLDSKVKLVAQNLNAAVFTVIGQEKAQGFEKAYLIANAISQLKSLLTPEYMTPIMHMQGNKLGFKTDKDKEKGYDVETVKNCLIEAVLFGLQPCGNQFNIIAGQMYATKEGIGYLLSKIQGLSYDIVPELPRIKDGSGAVIMNITWNLNGVEKSKKMDVAVKVNSFMGADAVIGKATRKARKWLYDTITGSEIPEGDVSDTGYTVVSSTPLNKYSASKSETKEQEVANKEADRFALLIDNCNTLEDVAKLKKQLDLIKANPQFEDLQNKLMLRESDLEEFTK